MNELIDYFVKMGFDPETAAGLASKVGKMAPPEPPIANGIKVDPTGAVNTLLTTRYGMEPAVAAGVAGKILGQDTLEAGPAQVHEDTLEPGLAQINLAKPADAVSGYDRRIPHEWYDGSTPKPTKYTSMKDYKPPPHVFTKEDYARADQLLYKLHPHSKAGADAITAADAPTAPVSTQRLRVLSGSDMPPWTTARSAGETK